MHDCLWAELSTLDLWFIISEGFFIWKSKMDQTFIINDSYKKKQQELKLICLMGDHLG